MKLSALEIHGFKSFADKTRLKFQDGITAVVGPNGSGKSNVSDAIKWVFGEQSAKSLRGSKMEDVIFGGTQDRKQQGFAMVSLTIDNSDRKLPNDNDEVIISRKLYRNGDSEYHINGKSARLLDVHEMFMDTGLGRDGYSVVEQGKINAIIGAKSQERREIFEEAAGISKLRHRKIGAERKLEKAEENLIRLRDIVEEKEKRIGPLRIQSEKAKQFLVFSEERKSLEISIWLEDLDKLRVELKNLENNSFAARGEHATIQKELSQIEEKLADFEQLKQEYNIYIDGKRNEIRELEENLGKATTSIAVNKNNMENNQARIEEFARQQKQSGSGESTLLVKIEATEKEIAELEKQQVDKGGTLEDLQEDIAQKREKNANLKDDIIDIDGQSRGLVDSKNKAMVDKASTDTLVDETVKRLEELKGGDNSYEETLGQLKDERKKTKRFIEDLEDKAEGLENSKSGYLAKLKGKEETLAQLQGKQANLEREIGQKLQKAQALSDLEKNMEGYYGSVKTIMKLSAAGAIGGIEGTVSSIITVDDQYSTAIEIALGATLQNVIVKDDGTAKRAISELRSKNAGRATFLPMTTIKGGSGVEGKFGDINGFIAVADTLVKADAKYQNIVKSLLGRIIIAEDMDSANVISKRCNSRYRVVTLDGQVINAGGSWTGGSSGKSGALLSRKNQIDELRSEAKEQTEQADEISAQVDKLSEECNKITAGMTGINDEIQICKEDNFKANAELDRIKRDIADVEERAEKLEENIAKLTRSIEELKKKNLSSDQIVKEFDGKIDSLAKQKAEAEKESSELEKECQEQAEEINSMKILLSNVAKDIEVNKENLANLQAEKENSAENAKRIGDEIEKLTSANVSLAADIERTEKMSTDSGALKKEYQDAIDKKLSDSNKLEQDVTELRNREKELVGQVGNVKMTLGKFEEQEKNLTDKTDNIVNQMRDSYEIGRTEAAELAIPIEDFAVAKKRLNELKNKIRGMGSVNVAAIEEYAEESKEYEFMSGQMKDIEGAKKELIKLITELSTEMSSMFLEKFRDINYHFMKIFTELFGGGKGELKLTEPENPLETGIDIYVQPPGKLIGSLTMLSGGEQAFVAICIYFAILKVSPAPFVLLDEIEAALDDVNVARYATYLTKMASNTQFITITHRRGTMEEADFLFGVTMEEQGVSKILQGDFKELVDKLQLEL